MIKCWIEAMRLRTLPVSVSGVIAGCACALMLDSFEAIPALLCLAFAVLAQIAANFGNEYYDFKNGIDQKGRAGFRRGVTEGEISPRAMRNATFITLASAAIIGCSMLQYGPLWLLLVGIVIIMFALAYSAGPFPLSHHGLGDIAVIIFFGIVPVTLTSFLQTATWDRLEIVLTTSVSVGLLAANVLIVNNYRDMEDDRAVGKRTTVVIFGRDFMSRVYLSTGIVAMMVMYPVWKTLSVWSMIVPIVYLALHIRTWLYIRKAYGSALNPLLGKTSVNLLVFSIMLLAVSFYYHIK